MEGGKSGRVEEECAFFLNVGGELSDGAQTHVWHSLCFHQHHSHVQFRLPSPRSLWAHDLRSAGSNERG